MEKNKIFVCVVCPKGCNITLSNEEGKQKIMGNKCSRGEKYVLDESTAPKRIITSTIKVDGGIQTVTSVKTTIGVPKSDIFAIMNIINTTKINSPVSVGDVILKNIGNTGADLVATRAC